MKEARPTLSHVEAARAAFEKNEPRELFYRASTELVALATESVGKGWIV